MEFQYHTLDVFTKEPFGGNQLAVFPDARGIAEEKLQKIANEMNLSETTFVYPPTDPDCDYKVRIFTPAQELPMAGHPTLGTTYVLAKQQDLKNGQKLTLTLEEGVGPVPVSVEVESGLPGLITMQQPNPVASDPFPDKSKIARLFSLKEEDLVEDLPVQVFDCGVPYMIIPVKTLSAVEAIKYRLDIFDELHRQYKIPFTFAFTLETVHPQNDVHCRMFAPEGGILEDPATGSAHGPLGGYLATYGLLGNGDIKFTSEQGYELGRPSELRVEIHKNNQEVSKVLVGGYCVEMGEGRLSI